MPPPYYRARYYHTDLQRFISEDPIGFRGGDVNVYAYVRNRPVSTTDPLGLWAAWFHRQTTRDAATNCGMSGADADALADATRAQDFMFFGLLPSFSMLSPSGAKHRRPGPGRDAGGGQGQAPRRGGLFSVPGRSRRVPAPPRGAHGPQGSTCPPSESGGVRALRATASLASPAI